MTGESTLALLTVAALLLLGPALHARDVASDVTNDGHDVTNAGHDVTNAGHDVTNDGHDVTNAGHDVTNDGHDVTNYGHDVTNDGHDVTNDGHDVTNDGHDVTDTPSLQDRVDRLERLLADQEERERSARHENVNWLQGALGEQRVLLQTQSQKLFRLEDRLRTQTAKLSYQERLLRQQNSKLSEQGRRLLRQDQAIHQLTATVHLLQRDETARSHVWSVPRVKDGVSVKGRVAGHSDHTVVPAARSRNDTVTSSLPRDVVVRSDDAGPMEAVVSQMSQQVSAMSADIQALKTQTTSDIQALRTETTSDVQTLTSDIQTLKTANSQQDQQIQDAQTSTYVHWGSSQCSDPSQLVYSGVVGGSHYTHSGAATNYLCLTMSPVLLNHAVGNGRAILYGTEYYTLDSHHDKDAVCAVCRSRHSSTIMIPGTNVCTPGWQREYSGYLMAGYYNGAAGSEFICVDSAMEGRPASNRDDNGKMLEYTFASCGSLPCDPYVNDKMVTCVVCSL